MTKMFDLSGKTVLVTGAGGGLGMAHTAALASAGARIIAADVDGEQLRSGLASAGLDNYDIHPVEMDVSDCRGAATVVEQCAGEHDGIDILVNNAGISLPAPLIDYEPSAFDRTMAVNLRGLFFLSQAFARSLRDLGRGGSIINIASIGGMVVDGPTSAAYDASKAAVIQLTRNLAVEFAPLGIRANAIAPGITRTEMTRRFTEDPDTLHELTTKKIPLGRVGEPEDMGGAVVFLASDAASYVTGHTLNVDGGWVAI
ncbi:MAG: glucose 1-dehydrogenase [Spiribacter salinus]|uniref:Glucose 1-dehydrogenase n=1 Tax=Spiribacter salinus TaxID=1335746 RepID=A0A540VTW3_9GAMM|nr:MAG: glucose 1-dehydrogenase [Spiribacter salinus]